MTDQSKIAPRVPTYEMVQAGAKVVRDNMPYHTGTKAIYEAMIAHCPDAPDANGVAVAWMRDAGGGKHAICEKPVDESAWIPLYTSSAAPVDEGLRADAARYQWWRENIDCIQDDGDGIAGVAYCWQIPMHGIDQSVTEEQSSAQLMDAIADRAIAALAKERG